MSEKATIRAFANGGEAVGTLEYGKTVFVRGAVPGEEVEVAIIQDKKRYARAELVKVLTPSEQRIKSDCPYFPACPGCSYRHVPYAVELEWKQKQLEYLLREFEYIKYHAPEGCSKRTEWRNKLTLHIENGKCGYKLDDNTTVLDINECKIATEPINSAIKLIDRALDRSITLRHTLSDGVTEVTRGRQNRKVLSENLGRHGVFKVRADGFFQTNPEIAEKLVSHVVEAVKESKTGNLCELYCGVGVFSVACAEKIPNLKCEGVELVKEAVQLASRNAINHSVSDSCEFYTGDAGTMFAKCSMRKKNDYILLVDPPRTGMDQQMTDGIKKYLPPEILYISCAADTLARDIKILSEYYAPESVKLFDMFPGTAHFETLAVLKRRK